MDSAVIEAILAPFSAKFIHLAPFELIWHQINLFGTFLKRKTISTWHIQNLRYLVLFFFLKWISSKHIFIIAHTSNKKYGKISALE